MSKRTLVTRISEYVDIISHIRLLKQILSEGGYLAESGWKKSQWDRKHTVMDRDGSNIPWLTYPFISFIEPRLTKTMDVFEYGCGYSSVWWADKCRTLTAVESVQEWIDIVQDRTKSNSNIKLLYANEKHEFCEMPEKTDKKYHIIIVDQADDMDRNMALKLAVNYLTSDGVVILDDSERTAYTEGKSYLNANGFKELRFVGLASTISYYGKTTAVFYRDENVLGI